MKTLTQQDFWSPKAPLPPEQLAMVTCALNLTSPPTERRVKDYLDSVMMDQLQQLNRDDLEVVNQMLDLPSWATPEEIVMELIPRAITPITSRINWKKQSINQTPSNQVWELMKPDGMTVWQVAEAAMSNP